MNVGTRIEPTIEFRSSLFRLFSGGFSWFPDRGEGGAGQGGGPGGHQVVLTPVELVLNLHTRGF